MIRATIDGPSTTLDSPVLIHHRPARRGTAVATMVTAMLAALSACGGDPARSTETFCGEVDERRVELTAPSLESSEDIEPLLDLYRDVGALAPLSIETEWDRLTLAYETASTVVPGDQESEQTALDAIFSTESSAAAINQWLVTNCAVDIGPVFTIVAHD